MIVIDYVIEPPTFEPLLNQAPTVVTCTTFRGIRTGMALNSTTIFLFKMFLNNVHWINIQGY